MAEKKCDVVVREWQRRRVMATPAMVTDDRLKAVGDTGKQGRLLVEGFAVQEPPVDAEAAAQRQAGVAALLAGFAHHLQERTAHHMGTCAIDGLTDVRAGHMQILRTNFTCVCSF
jgi:hypothetical protein